MALLVAAPALAGCTDQPPEPDVAGLAATKYTNRKVVAITVDGLRPGAIRQLGKAQVPAFYRMLREGAGTLNARTATEQTRTMPNHSGVFSGRRVLGSYGHQVTFNDDSAATDIHTVAGRYIPSMYDVVHDRGGRVEFYTGKDKFAFFDRSWDGVRGAIDTTGADNGRDKIDRYAYSTDTDGLVDKVIASVRKRGTKLTYLHLRSPDVAGHRYGYFSSQYLAAVKRSSARVGRLMRTIAGTASLSSTTAIVLTADHGGEGKDHSNITHAVNYTVPFLTWGAGIAKGRDLYALNPERVAPGAAEQPDYFSGHPPVRNLDLASLVTTYLGYGRVPGGLAPYTQPLRAWVS